MVTADFGPDDETVALALGTNGQIVVAGDVRNGSGPTSLALVRYNSDGTLDITFGVQGRFLGNTGSLSYNVDDVAVGPNNKVVTVGSLSGHQGGFFFIQSTDGTTFSAPPNFSLPPGEYNAVSFQSDGKIIAAGYGRFSASGVTQAVLVRYNTDGTVDTTFGNGGETVRALGSNLGPVDMLLQPDGKIVVSGSFDAATPQHTSLVRYQTNGTPDPTFGINGSVDGDQPAVLIAEGPGNTIVATGGPVSQLTLTRYTGDGAIVTSGATIRGTVYNDANGNGVRDNGEAPVAGRQVYLDLNGIGVFANGDPVSTTDANGAYSFTNLTPKNYLVRLVPQSGLVVTMPLYGGKYFVQLGQNQVVSGDDFGTQAVGAPNFPLPGGQLLVAGTAPLSQFTLTRYNADGSTDVSFGKFGIVTLPGGVGASPVNAVGQPNGQIIVTYAANIVTLGPTGAILSVVPTAATGGSISGTVYNDTNVNGVRDPAEAGVAGRQVYLDLNGIGVFASGDPITTTDANGAYSFGNLPAANYLVRLVPQAGKVITAPLFGGKYFVILGKNQAIAGDDFGTETVTGISATQSDGKLLVAGQFVNPYQTPFASVSRFNVDGATDTTFGGDRFYDGSVLPGTAVIDGDGLGGSVTQFYLPADGSILVQVHTLFGLGSSHNVSDVRSLQLLSRAGHLSNVKAVVGTTELSRPANHFLQDRVALTPDNKILAAGTKTVYGGPFGSGFGPAMLYVSRFNADLTPDLTFGGTGSVTIAGYGEPDSVTGLADGRVALYYGDTLLVLTSTGALA